ncbi:ATP-binding protein [Roseobacteraceae bacterium S113]
MISQMATVFSNARSLRALAAVAMIVALTVMFIFHQREMQDAKDRAMFAVSATTWKVSELMVESLRFSQALRLHGNGEVSRDRLQVRFDILWSRIDVVKNTDIEQDESLAEIIKRYETYLAELDPVIFGDGLVPPRFAVQRAYEVSDLTNEMRVAWVNAFAGRQFADVSLELFERTQGLKRQTLIALLVGLIAFYLVAEIFLAGAAQKKEAKLEAEATAAAMASAAKTRFLANVSHEIRTPLNGILGMASELGETSLDGDQRSCLKVITHAGDVLLNTLNDVLDLSKVESGQLELESVVFNLHDLADAAVALYRPKAEEKGLELHFERASNVPEFVRGDGLRISQVMHNLIGNAIKFTDEGQVTVEVQPATASGYVRFSVRDTGPGIDPSVHEKVFEPFSQADGSITRKKGGTGLGLSISRSLCDAMGGGLSLTSRLGHGAVFSFELPLPLEHTRENAIAVQLPTSLVLPGVTSEPQDQVPGQKVLVVDDNDTNRLLLRRFLKDQALDITEATNGFDAVDKAAACSFDLILMDIQMPGMDGIEAACRIRENERLAGQPSTRIIAVTANVMSHQTQAYLANGMDDVLGKPVSKKLF